MTTIPTYKKLCTEFYAREVEQRPDAQQALAFYLNYALQADGPILEPMCGTGRFLIPMLQAGLDIEGFDASEHMLNILRQKLALTGTTTAPVWQQLVQDFMNTKRYALIFVPFGSWGLITDIAIAQQALTKMFEHLKPGGTLVLEIETIHSIPAERGVWHRAEQQRGDGTKIVLNTRAFFDSASQLFSAECRYELINNNEVIETETELFTQYHYRYGEMDHYLTQAGFKNIKKVLDYSSHQGDEANAPIIIYECTK